MPDRVIAEPARYVTLQLGVGVLVSLPEMLDGKETLLSPSETFAATPDGLVFDANAGD